MTPSRFNARLDVLKGIDKQRKLLDAAAGAFEGWADATPGERQSALLKIADAVGRTRARA